MDQTKLVEKLKPQNPTEERVLAYLFERNVPKLNKAKAA